MEKVEVSAEKENDSATPGEPNQRRRLLKNMTRAELLALKKEVCSRIARCDATLNQLDKGFEDMKVFVVRMANAIEECQNLVKVEMQESKDLRHILRNTTFLGTCKTNVVIPMVGGIPLKKARISLKRLGPAYSQLYSRGTSSSETQPSNGSSNGTSSNATNTLEACASTRTRGRL